MAMGVLWVLFVVVPASAASLLVLVHDVRAHRRRLARPPIPSRLTAVLGAALGAGGFGLASFAGLGPTAHAAHHGPEQLWVATAVPGGGVAVAPVNPVSFAQLPFAPVAIWGDGFDGQGMWRIDAAGPGGTGIPLAHGDWTRIHGESVRALATVDPGTLVDAARANGVQPQNGAYTLVLTSPDPRSQMVFTLADRPQPPPPLPAPAPAPATANGIPPLTGSAAAAARPRTPAAATVPAPPTSSAPATQTAPGVGVPATGGGAPLLAGLLMLLAGGASAGLSLRLRAGGRRPPARR